MKPSNHWTRNLNGLTDARDDPRRRRWWQRIQWIDVVLVILAVVILLTLTAELWLPHYSHGLGR